MTYEAWRISYQSSEQAARAAYEECAQLHARIEAAEKERDWNAERLEDAIEECTALRAHIEKMEKQFPICRVKDIKRAHYMTKVVGLNPDAWLYALPGAKGE